MIDQPQVTKAITRRDLESRIVAKPWRDPAYKAALMRDPRGTLAAEVRAIDPSGTLPEGLQVYVHEESQNQYHLVLPRNPKEITLGEVVGDNLEAVAPQTVAVLTGPVVISGPAAVVTNVNNTVANVNLVAVAQSLTTTLANSATVVGPVI